MPCNLYCALHSSIFIAAVKAVTAAKGRKAKADIDANAVSRVDWSNSFATLGQIKIAIGNVAKAESALGGAVTVVCRRCRLFLNFSDQPHQFDNELKGYSKAFKDFLAKDAPVRLRTAFVFVRITKKTIGNPTCSQKLASKG